VRLLARAAQGSLGRAVKIDAKAFRAQRASLLDIIGALAPEPNRARLLRASEEWTDAKHKDEYEARLEALETLLRDVWALALGAKDELIINEDIHAQLARVSKGVTGRRVAVWLSQIEQLRAQLAVNINRKVATDALFLAMAKI
jgi:DNA polymerase-3 subunit delta'